MKHSLRRTIRVFCMAATLSGWAWMCSSGVPAPSSAPLLQPLRNVAPPVERKSGKTVKKQTVPDHEDIDQIALNARIQERRKYIESNMDEIAGVGGRMVLPESSRKDFFVGDLDQIRERGVLRVLISAGRTSFFFSKGRIRGFEFELMREFEKKLNQNSAFGQKPVRVAFIPTPFDELMDSLDKGLGDVAAAGMAMVPEQDHEIRFTRPYVRNVKEVVVVNRNVNDVERLEDLSGRKIYVQPDSACVEHLQKVNKSLASKGLPPIAIVEGDSSLSTDDVMQLVHDGAIKITVADSHVAQIWRKALPDIRVREDLAINKGGKIAWAVRKDNSQLRSLLNEFAETHHKGTFMGNILFERYFQKPRWINIPISPEERKKFSPMEDLFQKYGNEYGFDWLALAAIAYQESGFDHYKTSQKGAVGVMQVMPSTAADKSVRISNIGRLENNIHAGAKYLSFLREHYYASSEIAPEDRNFFAWAAYNAGPGRINQLRREAAVNGLDPNKWFMNVEKVASHGIGNETVEYVANVNKYYEAFRQGYEES